MGWSECNYKKIKTLKVDNILELPWDFMDDGEYIWEYEYNKASIAFIRISVDPIDDGVIWIDEFEVVRNKRKMGFGTRAIQEFLNEMDYDVKLLAKNKQVQLFWEKCGFEDDGITWCEIPMIFRKKK